MAGKLRYLLERDGRYFARLVIPKELRPWLGGKTELRSPLGGDYRIAARKLAGAVAELQDKISTAERQAAAEGRVTRSEIRYPLTTGQMARVAYEQRLKANETVRNALPFWSSIGIDDGFAELLRAGIAGRVSDDQMQELVGGSIDRFVKNGNVDVVQGTPEWRALARALCVAEYEALERMTEIDEGITDGSIKSPLLAAEIEAVVEAPALSINRLFDDYVASRQQIGFQRDGGRRQRPVIKSLVSFVGHADARRLTRSNIREWRDELMTQKSAKTVSDIYLSAIKSLLGWAVENDMLRENVAKDVRQPKPRVIREREIGYTDNEALAVLRFARAYVPKVGPDGRRWEDDASILAKRWIPLLCALTGARISEMTQLRKEDLFRVGDRWIIRITPQAGTVKSGGYRDVPLHQQLVDLGFATLVSSAPEGYLFSRAKSKDPQKSYASTQRLSGQLAEWLRASKLVPNPLSPNHAFRHRFKTVGRELGIQERVLAAICGHDGRTIGEKYGDVSMKSLIEAIDRFPFYKIT